MPPVRPIALLWAIAVLAAFVIGLLAGRTALALEASRPAPTEETTINGSVQDTAMSRHLVPLPARTSAPGASIEGIASWYCSATSKCTARYGRAGLYAAAGPRLRSALGPGWRGTAVTVVAGDRQVTVTLVDWCACADRLIDLYRSAFERLAPASRGLMDVQVRWPR